MNTIDLDRVRCAESLIGCVPSPSEFSAVLEPPVRLRLAGKTVGVYTVLPSPVRKFGHEIAAVVKPTSGRRSQGLRTKSAVFGSLPRVPIRNYYCRLSADSINDPGVWRRVRLLASEITAIYRRELPEEFVRHAKETRDAIVPDWVIEGTPFTTVNFNVNHAIRYHRDAANQKGVWSNVAILRKGCRGGLLVLPEYGVALSQRDGALILFDGQRVIHGVTPIVGDGYRVSIVLYALDAFRNCYPFAEELEHAKNHRTEVEQTLRSPKLLQRVAKGHNANEAIAKGRRARKRAT